MPCEIKQSQSLPTTGSTITVENGKKKKKKYHPGPVQTCKLSNKISEPDATKDE